LFPITRIGGYEGAGKGLAPELQDRVVSDHPSALNPAAGCPSEARDTLQSHHGESGAGVPERPKGHG
jgi:tRNA(Met) C34 N-acetyltransferase TmcA